MDDGRVDGNLIYYNEPAEGLLGVRFDDVGMIRAEQLVGMWQVTRSWTGRRSPTRTSRSGSRSASGCRCTVPSAIRGLDGVWRGVEVTAIPIEGQGGRFHGVLATFWEVET